MTKYTFHQVNAFTKKDQKVLGNPAAICLCDTFPDQKFMEQAAKKLGLPMTSFVKYTDDPTVFEIRHFSPDGQENHVCGHATLAAAELLAKKYPQFRHGTELTFRLNPKYSINASNSFQAVIKGRDIALTLPAVTELKEVTDPAFYQELAEALRISESDIIKPAFYAPRIINYVVEVKDQAILLGVKPDFEKLKTLAASKNFEHEGIMLTTPSQIKGFDILTRVFLPIIGVDEDIACGSANCSVLPYWTLKREGAFPNTKQDFKALFPYPPQMHEKYVGGVQNLSINHKTKEIKLAGQAAYKKCLNLDNTPKIRKKRNPTPK